MVPSQPGLPLKQPSGVHPDHRSCRPAPGRRGRHDRDQLLKSRRRAGGRRCILGRRPGHNASRRRPNVGIAWLRRFRREVGMIRLSCPDAIRAGLGERQFRFTASTSTLGRDGNIVDRRASTPARTDKIRCSCRTMTRAHRSANASVSMSPKTSSGEPENSRPPASASAATRSARCSRPGC
jgi:hypothetical protein